jgi:outer membrane protein TolC
MRYFFWASLFFPFTLIAQPALTLADAVGLAQRQSVAAKVAENIRENKYYHWQAFRAALRPQLGIEAGLPMYSRDFLEVRQPDGGIRFLPRAQNNAQMGLSLSQVLAGTGGRVSLRADMTRFDDFDRGRVFYSGTPLSLALEQPLFAFNPFKWSRQIEPMKLEEAGKLYKFQMEAVALQAVQLFFDVVEAREAVRIAGLNLENNRLIHDIEKQRIALGTTTREKLLQVEMQVLHSSQGIQEANADLQSALLQLQVFLGTPNGDAYTLIVPEAIPEQSVDTALAIQMAREHRAEFVEFERRKLEAARDIEEAQRSRLQVNLQVTLGFNGAGERLPEVFSPLKDRQRLGLAFFVPVIDWGRARAREGLASANAQVVAYSIVQEESTLSLQIVNQVKALEILRSNIGFARAGNRIGGERYRLALEQYHAGKLTLTDLNIALAEKDIAQKAYFSALRRYWEAHYRLRQMTLYDFWAGQGI